jgi:serine phosphatase RsbU (regulator of sigma subunit)/PAS domain-containing protein
VTWQWSLPAALMEGAAALLLALSAYVYPRRRSTGGVALLLVLLAVAVWSMAYGLELASVELEGKLAWGDLKYLGIGLLAPAWLAFALSYTGRRRMVSLRTATLLSIEPAVMLALLSIDRTHDLVRYYPPGAAAEELPVVAAGPLFWAHLAYTNVLLLGGTVLWVVSLARISRAYWRQIVVLVAAALVPWVVNLLFNLGVAPFHRIDFTPVAFGLTAVVVVWGVFRQRLLDLVPVAHGVVLSTMRDGVLVLDAYGRIVDLNPAASRIIDRPRNDVIGWDAAPLLAPIPSARSEPGGVREDGVLDLATADGLRSYEPIRSPLLDSRRRRTGEVLVLRDVTERVLADRRLRRLLAEQTRVARTLQQSLLPAVLPEIPGVALAARYRPAGDGSEIGGDFYDVFPDRDGRWMVVLGDVSGKGAEAAGVTALVRYTLRTLALQQSRPAAVLRALNDVFLHQAGDERYCTLACASLRLAHDRVEVTLALAGHPQPLLARADGEVSLAGEPGTALGLLDEPEFTEVELTLHRGDVLCLYTDGVTEARSDSDWFGEDRAGAVLAWHQERGLDDLAERIERAVLDFQGDHAQDDIALLLLRPWCADLPGPRDGADPATGNRQRVGH